MPSKIVFWSLKVQQQSEGPLTKGPSTRESHPDHFRVFTTEATIEIKHFHFPWPSLRGPLRNHFWKKNTPISRIGGGGENSANALNPSNALIYRALGIKAVISMGNSRKKSESVSGVFPEFLRKSLSRIGGMAQKSQPLLVSEKVRQYTSNLYGNTPPILYRCTSLAPKPWRKKNPTIHLPFKRICSTFEKVLGVGVTGKFLSFVNDSGRQHSCFVGRREEKHPKLTPSPLLDGSQLGGSLGARWKLASAKTIAEVLPCPSFLVFPCEDFFAFFSVFPLFSRDFRGSVGM